MAAEDRTYTVSVRLNDDERKAWEAAMRAAGRGRLGTWVREVVNATLDAPTTEQDAHALRRIAARLEASGEPDS